MGSMPSLRQRCSAHNGTKNNNQNNVIRGSCVPKIKIYYILCLFATYLMTLLVAQTVSLNDKVINE